MATILRRLAGAFILGSSLALAARAAPQEKPEPAVDALWLAMRQLGPEDVARYHQIWELQSAGKWAAADAVIRALDNPILLGHVKFQRYMHPTAYRSSFHELADWMARYGDHPGAERVYELARKRQGKAPAPRPPATTYAKGAPPSIVAPDIARTRAEALAVAGFRRQFLSDVARTRLTKAGEALAAFMARGLLSPDEIGRYGAHLAQAWFNYGDDEKAFAIAARAAEKARGARHTPDWLAGLAAWRMGKCDVAARHFGHVAAADDAREDALAAGAFWAARAELACRRPQAAFAMLRQAALYDLSFYGQIAERQLGVHRPRDWEAHQLEPADWAALTGEPAVARAVALTQIGRIDLADREVHGAWQRADAALFWPLIKLATTLNLPEAQVRIAETRPRGVTAPLAALYPVPDWRPVDGFQMDRALIFALMRQESRFAAHAKSHAGARGLMQVMPRTASFIAGDRRLVRDRERRLYDPEFNMALGQRYLGYLTDQDVTYGNMFMVLAAYNAGPGNLARWLKAIDYQDDPLFFMEAIPNRETRNYVERVMANYWLYRRRLGQATPSLDAVAASAWPPYDPLDEPAAPAQTPLAQMFN